MKPKMKRKDLKNQDDIWNAVIGAISENDFPSENKEVNEASVVFYYYSEMESGGHEMLLNWLEDYIKEVGILHYQDELINILEKIGAHNYAVIERTYLEELWNLYIALEGDETQEEKFYSKIELADNEYCNQNRKLDKLLENYFLKIYTHLIDVVED